MSFLSADSIKLIGEFAGISNLKDDVALALAQDIEYRLRDIIQEAMKFMRHAKRTRLTTDDINHALQVRNVEVSLGSVPVFRYLSMVRDCMGSIRTHLSSLRR